MNLTEQHITHDEAPPYPITGDPGFRVPVKEGVLLRASGSTSATFKTKVMGRDKTGIHSTAGDVIYLYKNRPLCEQLREIRIALGVSASAVSREMKYDVSNMHHYEKNKAGDSLDMAAKYARALGAKVIVIII